MLKLANFINDRFANEPLLAPLFPVDGHNREAFYGAWRDGLLLFVLVDAASEGILDLASMRRRAQKPLGVISRAATINNTAVLNEALAGAKKMDKIKIDFVGADDFIKGNRHVILGVGWQLVRLVILKNANVMEL